MLTPAILTAAALAGLLGGAHCAGMCGGIMAALHGRSATPVDGMAIITVGRPRLAAWPIEQAGRILGYVLAGALVATLNAGIGGIANPAQSWSATQAMLFGLMNLVLIVLGLQLLGTFNPTHGFGAAGARLWKLFQPVLTRVWPPHTPVQRLTFGLVWGWVPCGLVYSLLPLALLSGKPVHGALLMLVFGLGTLPGLLAAGWGIRRLANIPRLADMAWPRRVAGVAIIAWGLVGAAHAVRVVEQPVGLLAYWCTTAL